MIKEYVRRTSLIPGVNLKENSLQEIFQFLSFCDSKFIPLFGIEDESKIIGFRIFTADAEYVKEVFLGDNVYIIKGENGNACVYNWIDFRKYCEARNISSFDDKETPMKVDINTEGVYYSTKYDEDINRVVVPELNYDCPRCGLNVVIDNEYCPHCGQHLNWGNEN